MTAQIEGGESQRRSVVGVIGDGTLPAGAEKGEIAERLGRRLVDEGYRIACGGLAGVMESVCRGARRSEAYVEGCTIGILPGSDASEANRHVDIAIPTGLGHARNTLVAQSDAVVAIGGGAGTLSEVAFAWIMDRLIIAFRVHGWSGTLAGDRLDERERLPDVDGDRVFGVDDADEVIEILDRRLADYRTGCP